MNTATGMPIPYINKVRYNHMNKDVSGQMSLCSSTLLSHWSCTAGPNSSSWLQSLEQLMSWPSQTPLAGPEYMTEEKLSILVKKVFNGN